MDLLNGIKDKAKADSNETFREDGSEVCLLGFTRVWERAPKVA